MSCIYKGKIIDTNQSHSAMGGTEQMRARLLKNADPQLLSGVAVHLSRVRKIYDDVPNVFWAHDTAEDPENKVLEQGCWNKFDRFVFVSHWQKATYQERFGISDEKSIVIENAIEPAKDTLKSDDKIRLIYHTTPHRGLAILVPVFEALMKRPELKNKIHLDVFSSFEIYGWKQRDERYAALFQRLNDHPNATYHGTQPNSVVRDYLSRAHYFPYPCIWKETSCIALIEAIEHKVLAIHPDYGALGETAGNNTMMYGWLENPQEHAERFYTVLIATLNQNAQKDRIINNRLITSNRNHNIASFTAKWNNLLKELQYDK